MEMECGWRVEGEMNEFDEVCYGRNWSGASLYISFFRVTWNIKVWVPDGMVGGGLSV